MKKVLMLLVPFVLGVVLAISCNPGNGIPNDVEEDIQKEDQKENSEKEPVNENTPNTPADNQNNETGKEPEESEILSCVSGEILEDGVCKKILTEDIPGCASYSKTECIAPESQYELRDGELIYIPIDIEHCTSTDSDKNCVSCESGYVLENGVCKVREVEKAVVCSSDQVLENGVCVAENSGNTTSSGTQPASSTGCPSGYAYNSKDNTCSLAPAGTYAIGGKNPAIRCPSGYYSSRSGSISCTKGPSFCAHVDSKTGKCLSCASGYLYSDGRCVEAPAGTYSPGGTVTKGIPCESNTYSEGKASACTPCPDGEVSSEGSSSCVKKPDNCKTYDPSNERCLSCHVGHELKDGLCISN